MKKAATPGTGKICQVAEHRIYRIFRVPNAY